MFSLIKIVIEKRVFMPRGKYIRTKEVRDKNRRATILLWQDPGYQTKQCTRIKEAMNRLEVKEKLRSKAKYNHSNPDSIYNSEEYEEKI